jgi:ABC-type glycerol-3-phosphate transport system permease component
MKARRGIVANTATYLVLTVAVVAALAPVIWVVETSLKTNGQATAFPPQIFRFHPTLANYTALFGTSTFRQAAETSVAVTLCTTVLVLGVALMAGYALARLRMLGRRLFVMVMVLIQVIPAIVLVIPLFTLVSDAHLYDHWTSLILVLTGLNIPFATWLLMAFVRSFPVEIEEAAIVDGAGRFTLFRRIVLPMIGPGIGTAAIFTAISVWNTFLIPVVLGQSHAETLTVFASQFVTQQQIEWGGLCATAVVIMAPIVIFVLILQRPLVRGISLGSLKG